MEAKDASYGFDFTGTYIDIRPETTLVYELADDRLVTMSFETNSKGVEVVEEFIAEDANSGEQQKAGWQAILENFKAYVEVL